MFRSKNYSFGIQENAFKIHLKLIKNTFPTNVFIKICLNTLKMHQKEGFFPYSPPIIIYKAFLKIYL